MNDQPHSHRIFIERLVITIAVLAVVLLTWALRDLLILVFGSVLLSVILQLIADPIQHRLKLPGGVALFCAVLILVGLFALVFWMFGSELARQGTALTRMIPEAWEAVQAQLAGWGLGDIVGRWADQLGGGAGVMGSLSNIAISIGSGLADTVLVIAGAIYLAAQPKLYRTGVIKMVPEQGRPLVAEALEDSGNALRLWLLGRIVSMSVVGLLTFIGLSIIGVPSALMLGLVAALLEFVPFIGPIVSSIPAILLAFAVSPTMALWTAFLYLGIQQFEGNVLEPLVQQRAVSIPPALLLFSVVAGGLLFGVIGILFAGPLIVVTYVLVKRLYVREALHTKTPVPGEKNHH